MWGIATMNVEQHVQNLAAILPISVEPGWVSNHQYKALYIFNAHWDATNAAYIQCIMGPFYAHAFNPCSSRFIFTSGLGICYACDSFLFPAGCCTCFGI